jgi:hypothetical protein
MRSIRFSIGGLMGVVLLAAVGLAALKNASGIWAGAMFMLTCAVLALAVVGVVCRSRAERAWWLGIALFGWGYLALAFLGPERFPRLPTIPLLEAICLRLGLQVEFLGPDPLRSDMIMGAGFSGAMLGGGATPTNYAVALAASQIGHCMWAVLAALLGGLLARALFAIPASASARPGGDAPGLEQGQETETSWRRRGLIGLVGIVLIATVVLTGWKLAPGLGTGGTFLLTCALFGVATLGAVYEPGRRREVWLGATLFGVGYMIAAFGPSSDQRPWPDLPTNHLLIAVRPYFPPKTDGAPGASVLKHLEQPVPMHFPNETQLAEVLRYIKDSTRAADGKGLAIYVDPIGLQEAERTEQSVVTIDLEGVPLRITLALILKQLGMAYMIRDSVVLVTSESAAEGLPVYKDSFLIVGHCLLALVAAGLGGLAAPLMAGMRRKAAVQSAPG